MNPASGRESVQLTTLARVNHGRVARIGKAATVCGTLPSMAHHCLLGPLVRPPGLVQVRQLQAAEPSRGRVLHVQRHRQSRFQLGDGQGGQGPPWSASGRNAGRSTSRVART